MAFNCRLHGAIIQFSFNLFATLANDDDNNNDDGDDDDYNNYYNYYFKWQNVFLSALVNVALGRRTFMSQPYIARGSSLAVDGNRNSSVEVVGSCSVTHSSGETKSWWAVDLGVVANVTSVAISQRDKKGKIYLLGKLRSLFSVM